MSEERAADSARLCRIADLGKGLDGGPMARRLIGSSHVIAGMTGPAAGGGSVANG